MRFKLELSALREGKPLPYGIKGEIRFDQVDLDNGPIVQFRDGIGGRARGFPMTGALSLPEMMEREEYRDLLKQIFRTAKEITERLAKIFQEGT